MIAYRDFNRDGIVLDAAHMTAVYDEACPEQEADEKEVSFRGRTGRLGVSPHVIIRLDRMIQT